MLVAALGVLRSLDLSRIKSPVDCPSTLFTASGSHQVCVGAESLPKVRGSLAFGAQASPEPRGLPSLVVRGLRGEQRDPTIPRRPLLIGFELPSADESASVKKDAFIPRFFVEPSRPSRRSLANQLRATQNCNRRIVHSVVDRQLQILGSACRDRHGANRKACGFSGRPNAGRGG